MTVSRNHNLGAAHACFRRTCQHKTPGTLISETYKLAHSMVYAAHHNEENTTAQHIRFKAASCLDPMTIATIPTTLHS